MEKNKRNYTDALNAMFRGVSKNLNGAIRDTKAGVQARNVAREWIEPIIATVNKNAGQEMDPTYVAYIIQFAHGK